jgi:ribose transport system substrate-binding protein
MDNLKDLARQTGAWRSGRREFLRRAALLGLSLGAAEQLAATLGHPGEAQGAFSFKIPKHPPTHLAKVDTAKYKTSPPLKIGYADASQSNSWRIMTKANVDYAASTYGSKVQLLYTNANDSVPKQISDIEDLVTRGAQAIIIGATDDKAVCPSIVKLNARGIPSIILERAVQCTDYTTFINTDLVWHGILMMEYVCQKIGGKGNVVIIGGAPGNGATVDVMKGYKEVLGRYPNVRLLATDYAYYDPAKGRQVMENFLTAYSKIDGIAIMSGNMGIGVYKAVAAAGRVSQIKAWTGDDANGWLKIVAKEKLPSMNIPDPVTCGQDAVRAAVDILEGRKVTNPWLVQAPMITDQNIGQYVRFDRPDEWWYSKLPDRFDPYAKK